MHLPLREVLGRFERVLQVEAQEKYAWDTMLWAVCNRGATHPQPAPPLPDILRSPP